MECWPWSYQSYPTAEKHFHWNVIESQLYKDSYSNHNRYLNYFFKRYYFDKRIFLVLDSSSSHVFSFNFCLIILCLHYFLSFTHHSFAKMLLFVILFHFQWFEVVVLILVQWWVVKKKDFITNFMKELSFLKDPQL